MRKIDPLEVGQESKLAEFFFAHLTLKAQILLAPPLTDQFYAWGPNSRVMFLRIKILFAYYAWIAHRFRG
jgi:hypothetical protein